MMKRIHMILMVGLLALTGCADDNTAQGGGSNNSLYGHLKIALPF